MNQSLNHNNTIINEKYNQSPFKKSISGSGDRLRNAPPVGALLCRKATIFEFLFFIISYKNFFSFSCCIFSTYFIRSSELISTIPDFRAVGMGNLIGVDIGILIFDSGLMLFTSFLTSVFSLNLI
jgi:hypothetical protein